MEFEAYDLGEEGHGFAPLALSRMHRGSLHSRLRLVFSKIVRAIPEILGTYSTVQSMWDVPPLFSGYLSGVSLQITADVFSSNGAITYKDYVAFVKAYETDGGLSNRLRKNLITKYGELASCPYVFTQEGYDIRRFVIEYVMLISRKFAKGLMLDETNSRVFIRLAVDGGWKEIGVKDGYVIHPDLRDKCEWLSPAKLFDWLLEARGIVTTKHYGAYDRAKTWAERNYDKVEDVDSVIRALSLLKLCCDPEAEMQFEQVLRNSRVAEEVKIDEETFSLDRLDELRAVWIDSGNTPAEEAFLNLFSKFVPYYTDSEGFKKLFGRIPELDKQLTPKQLDRIDAGLRKFEADFLTKRRQHLSRK